MIPAPLRGLWIRALQILALYAPGARTTRVGLHRLRGVHIGRGCFIGTAALIETDMPQLVMIGDRVDIGIRSIILAHFRGTAAGERDGVSHSVRIEDEAFVGPGAIVLPNVTIGRGAVVTAGSVVTRSVPPLTMVQGNPAQPVARCGIPLTTASSPRDFYRRLRPLARPSPR